MALASPAVITVFGSSRPLESDAAYGEARGLGAELAARGWTVCTGGYGGVMEAVSRGAKEAGGHTMAVTASFFRARANRWVDEEVRVDSWQERLFELIRRGRGYVACAGGTGTLAELAVVWEMLNKDVMRAKPFVALGEFWRPIIDCVWNLETGYASPSSEANSRGAEIKIAATPAEAAKYLSERLGERPGL